MMVPCNICGDKENNKENLQGDCYINKCYVCEQWVCDDCSTFCDCSHKDDDDKVKWEDQDFITEIVCKKHCHVVRSDNDKEPNFNACDKCIASWTNEERKYVIPGLYMGV